MTLFWTIIAVIAVLAVLALSHTVAWCKGVRTGKHCASLDEINARLSALNEKHKAKLTDPD